MRELGLQKAAGALGACVSGIGLADVAASEQVYIQVREALNKHEVLFFRDQDMAPEVFAAFAKCFGDILDHPAYATTEQSDAVQILESTPQNPSKIELWHSDMTFMTTPPSFTLLQGQIIPEIGGDTLWASATAAFSSLSKELQELLAPLTAVHDFAHGFAESLAEPGGAERLAPALAENPPVEHPLVRTHPETGRRAIFMNPIRFSPGLGPAALGQAEMASRAVVSRAQPEQTGLCRPKENKTKA